MAKTKPKLKRTLGFWEVTLAGIGIILGAGVYALIGKAAGITENATWISFIIAGIVSAFTALSYAELGAIFPKAGAEYEYTNHTFGKCIAFLVGWMIIIGTSLSASTVALGFAGYLDVLLPSMASLPFLALILVVATTALNIYGIKLSATIGVAFALIETAGLVIIILLGIPHLGSVDYFALPEAGISALFTSAALIFFAFIGFESIPRLAEETKNPERTVPWAVVSSLVISTIIYVLVAISVVSVLPWQDLSQSNAPLADVAGAVLGGDVGLILAVIAIFATSNTVLLMLVAGTRLVYGMAKSEKTFEPFGKIHPTRKTPWIAALFLGLLSVVFLFFGDIVLLANATNFTILLTFFIINLSVIWICYAEPNLKRPFICPRINGIPIIAVFGAVTSILLMSNLGSDVIVGGLGLVVVLLVGYHILKWTSFKRQT